MRSIINSRDFYNIINKYGIVEIFNHTTFSNSETYSDRIGADIDVDNLKQSLNFYPTKITVNTDFSIQQIVDRVNALGTIEMNVAFVMIIFLTYGEKYDHLVAYDGVFPVDNLIKIFCENLTIFAGIPKIFVINASRGAELDQGYLIDDKYNENVTLLGTSNQSIAINKTPLPIQSLSNVIPKLTLNDLKYGFSQNKSYETPYVIPRYADTLIFYSTFKGFVSFRNSKGSFLIQELCEVLNECKNEISDLFVILTKTVSRVSFKEADSFGAMHEKKQIPVLLSTLRKTLLFTPKSMMQRESTHSQFDNILHGKKLGFD